MAPPTIPVDLAIERRIQRGPEPNSCWLWTGQRDKDGYPRISRRPKNVLIHRWMWERENGRSIPTGLMVCHHCDNPPCVNPAHLFIGTAKDNRLDCLKKNRAATGSAVPNYKLTDDDVRAILKSTGTLKEVAKQFGVAFSTISRIRRRTHRKHLKTQ